MCFLVRTTKTIVMNTAIEVQSEYMYELQASPPRRFGLLVLHLICERLLKPIYNCQDFSPEKDGCDVVLTECSQPPLRPKACIESKYVENFWIKESTLLQQVKDAARKLRRVETHDVVHRFFLVSSFALKRQARASDKIFKHAHQYVILVLLVTSKAIEENPRQATQEIVVKAKELTEEESLEAVSNISVVMLNDKLAEFEDQVGMNFEQMEAKVEKRFEQMEAKVEKRFEQITKRQERFEQKLQELNQEQQLLRKGQQEITQGLLEIKTLLTNVLTHTTEEE